MIVLGLDIETNSIEVDQAEIIELGLVLWDTEKKKALNMEGILIRGWSIPAEITCVHGITEEETSDFGIHSDAAMAILHEYQSMSEYIIAHNGNQFDRPIVERTFEREMRFGLHKDWIDTMTDIPYPELMKTRKLSHLAAEHGFVNPFPHRAVFDVMTMLRIMSSYDFDEIVKISKEPIITVRANVSFEGRQEAKNRGYFWDADKKIWFKTLKQSLVETEQKEAPFKVIII